MNKNVVIYFSSTAGSIFKNIVLELKSCLLKQKFNVFIIDIADIETEKILLKVLEKGIFFSLGFNCASVGLSISNKLICDLFNYPHFIIMTEVPYHILSTYIFDVGIKSKNNILLYLDKYDYGYIKYVRQETKSQFKDILLPLAGMKYKKQDIVHKDIDVLYCASYAGPFQRDWNNKKYSENVKKFLNLVVDYLEIYPVTVHQAFTAITKEYSLLAGFINNKYDYYPEIFQYIKAYRRVKIVEGLLAMKININICGYWPETIDKRKIHSQGILSYGEVLKMYKRSKIIISDNAGINGGIHERVISAMLNGAIVISEYSSYLDKFFIDKKEIILYDYQNLFKIKTAVNFLLKNDEIRNKMSYNAYKKVAAYHRWDNRVKVMLDLANKWYLENYVRKV